MTGMRMLDGEKLEMACKMQQLALHRHVWLYLSVADGMSDEQV